MNKINRFLLALLCLSIVIICILTVYAYKYKSDYQALYDKHNRYYVSTDTLSYIDCMVLSGDSDAYEECNGMRLTYSYNCGSKDSAVCTRDYLLYCYIFALRDKNPYAATELSNYYLDNQLNDAVHIDSSMVVMTRDLLNDVFTEEYETANAFIKWLAAFRLIKIYSGDLGESFKDTVLLKKFEDTLSKYVK